MKHLSTTTARRAIALAAAVAAAGLATTTAAFAATSAPSAAVTAGCAAAAGPGPGLAVWIAADQGNGAAGTIFYPLEFTNLSGHTCSLHGFPGVSAIDRSGRQLGSPAGWGSQGPARTVILVPGATAHAVLAYHDAVVGGAGCDAVNTASKLRVYPPGQRTAAHAFFDLPVCSHPGPVYLDVGPIQRGAGIINN